MSNNIEFIKEEWKNIPLNIRHLILVGLFYIGLSWLIDNWSNNNSPKFFGRFDMNTFLFTSGLLLFLIGTLIIILKQILNFPKRWLYIYQLRKKYPIEKKDESFHLVCFQEGKYILFDKKEKKHHHITPWQTAIDLQFAYEAKEVETKFSDWEKGKEIEISKNITISASDYDPGEKINTQLL